MSDARRKSPPYRKASAVDTVNGSEGTALKPVLPPRVFSPLQRAVSKGVALKSQEIFTR
jgi:hypothetical protein